MENMMKLPANYNVMNEEEMTYVQGGAFSFADIRAVAGVAAGIISLVNAGWGIMVTRDWIAKNKKGATIDNAVELAQKGANEVVKYASGSLGNAAIAMFTTMNMTAWLPLTVLGWLTA
ncbi:MAG: hypothetical protein ACI4LE_05015 [Faecalibacterium sp.]